MPQVRTARAQVKLVALKKKRNGAHRLEKSAIV